VKLQGRFLSPSKKNSVTPEPSTNFEIDLFCDGVQLFKNSAAAQAYVLLARVHKVAGKVIPIRRALPFIVGIYHGDGERFQLKDNDYFFIYI
jgi:hypothetical protein